MKQYYEWLEQSHVSPKQAFKCEHDLKAAFKAGMLAAADIVVDMIADDRRAGIYEHLEYAKAIRKAAE